MKIVIMMKIEKKSTSILLDKDNDDQDNEDKRTLR